VSGEKKERWGSRLGVILAVAGSAVGLGNFIRFPGQAAQYGGGAYMIAYFLALLLLGLPIGWAEWTLGRMGGLRGFNGAPGIMGAVGGNRAWRMIGVIGVIIPVVIYMYYVYIEAWCLGYAVNFFRGALRFGSAAEAGDFWGRYIGVGEDGSAVGFGFEQVGGYLALCFALNFLLIYRGLSKGIEWFCSVAMPVLVLLAIVIAVRVLTLGVPDPSRPDNSVMNGLGFMWNPTKQVVEENREGRWLKVDERIGERAIAAGREAVAGNPAKRLREVGLLEQLKNPQLWLAAAGQIFFSLSVGFGVVITYSSYLSRKDDVVLSGASAVAANEFCEVALGGLITIPAAVAFLGVADVAGKGTFGLGFNVLPMVFSKMPAGNLFGGAFFFLIFLAAITSSLSMLQPGIAFLEEALEIGRRRSVALLGFVTAIGVGFVVYFSKDAKALDTLDFWVGTFLIFILATFTIILFSWVLGIERGFAAAHEGAAVRIPAVFKFIMKYVSPLYLVAVFGFWFVQNVLGFSFETGESKLSPYVLDLVGGNGKPPDKVAIMSVVLIGLVGAMFALIAFRAPAYEGEDRPEEPK
jgi:SNF family Na+-dependent transporter